MALAVASRFMMRHGLENSDEDGNDDSNDDYNNGGDLFMLPLRGFKQQIALQNLVTAKKCMPHADTW